MPPNAEYVPRREPPECPYCGRIMTWREKDEQGACNDCYEPYGYIRPAWVTKRRRPNDRPEP